MKKLLVFFSIFGITTLPAMASVDCKNTDKLFKTYCDDENYIFQNTRKPAYGLLSTYSDSVSIGCYKFKNNDHSALKKATATACGISESKVTIRTGLQRDSSHIKKDTKEPAQPSNVNCGMNRNQGILKQTYINGKCVPSECLGPRWKLSGTGASAKCAVQKCQIENGTGEWVSDDDNWSCKVKSCDNKYTSNQDNTKCILICSEDEKSKLTNATKTGIENGKCVATECECGYNLQNGQCTAWAENEACFANKNTGKPYLPKNAKTGVKACQDGKAYCKITTCVDNYDHDKTKNECNSTNGEPCTHSDTNATKAEYKIDKKTGTRTCIIKKCKDGFDVSKDGSKCIPECPCGQELSDNNTCVDWRDTACTTDGKPELPSKAVSGTKKCNDKGKAYCEVTECETDYKKNKDATKCISVQGDECDSGDENAIATKYKDQNGKMVCIITECASKYEPSDNQTKCVPKKILSKEDSEKQIAELRENAQKMKDKEQSTENKLLGAVGMGATGIGLMQTMSASAEQSADEDAEQDMKAYLATMHCNYGGGKNIVGGETAVELPGGNELTPLYAEYVQLASDLKIRKTALDMLPGIESEVVFDKAQTGLYDDIATGKTGGAYTSLARALSDETSADAVAWAQQKADTADKKKTGLIVAGVGAVASLAGNLAINSGKNKQDKTDEILAKYEPLKQIFQQAEQEQRSLPAKKCSEFTGTTGAGTAPNCTCTNENAYFNMEQGCVDCTDGYTVNANKNDCECVSPRVEADGQCIEKAPQCKYTGLVQNPTSADCTCAQYAVADSQNICDCDYSKGFTKGNAQCVCSTDENKEIKDNNCVCKNGYQALENNGTCEKITNVIETPLNEGNAIIEINIKSDTTFASSSAKISSNKAQEFLSDFNTKLSKQQNLLQGNDYCVKITGHTDRTKFKLGSNWNNQRLSEARADAIKTVLTKNNTIPVANIQTSGEADKQCLQTTYPQPNDERCRRVNVQVVAGKCK